MKNGSSFIGSMPEPENTRPPLFRRAIVAVASGYGVLFVALFVLRWIFVGAGWPDTGDGLLDGFIFVGVVMLFVCFAIAAFVTSLFFATSDWSSPAYGRATKVAVVVLSVAGILIPVKLMWR